MILPRLLATGSILLATFPQSTKAAMNKAETDAWCKDRKFTCP